VRRAIDNCADRELVEEFRRFAGSETYDTVSNRGLRPPGRQNIPSIADPPPLTTR
jgi:hypothetical protein